MRSTPFRRFTRFGWVVLLPALSWADSGVGVDTWRANKLDPTGGRASEMCDPAGTSWLSPLEHRSPTGNLYDCPAELPFVTSIDQWFYYGLIEVGDVGAGSERYALWNRYTDWRQNQPVGAIDMHFEHPADGTYAEVRGSHLTDDDQYYQAVYGQAGAFKVQAFLRDMPNILSTDARPIWGGVGSNVLTLPPSLTPGESTSAQVAAVSAATPVQTLKVERRKEGLNLSRYFTPHWSAYLDVTHERREGARPYGGPFGEDWAPNTGAILETVKPIDDSTINLNTGARYAGGTWRADFGYSGSYYRDQYRSYSFEQPFFIPTLAPAGTIAPPITEGQMSMEPNNDYHNVHGTITRVLPMRGELSLSLSEVLMTQRDRLIAPTNCQGFLGWGTPSVGNVLGPQDVGPQNPNLLPCSQWNTPAALSQSTADVNMHNTLADVRLALRPRSDLDVDAGIKYYRQAYDNDYIAYNPQNGDYGYILENGAYFREYGTPASITSGAFPPGTPPTDGRIRPYLLSLDDTEAHGGFTWRLSERDSVGLLYTFDQYRPTSRERDHVDDNSIRLNWTDKALAWLTLRANYSFLKQTGSVYNNDVYGYTFLHALPGFEQAYPSFVAPPETVSALRIYDIADRTENKVDVMATLAPRDDLTISASFRGDWNSYPAVIGREDYSTAAAQISVDWAPTPTDSASAYVGYDRSTLSTAGVSSGTGFRPTCAELGCPFYPLSNQWSQSDHERNYSAGATLFHRIDFVTLDLAWTYTYSRGLLYYSAQSPQALVYPDEFATMGNGFPPMTYRVDSFTAGVTFKVGERVSLRIFDNYEVGQISDWHYTGFSQGLVVGNTLYTDGGPQSYVENLIGILIRVKL